MDKSVFVCTVQIQSGKKLLVRLADVVCGLMIVLRTTTFKKQLCIQIMRKYLDCFSEVMHTQLNTQLHMCSWPLVGLW